ncbi:MAG: hypothetical protein WED04_06910 [Promethearchaeati archaeon SRVP18_Atabeyarchaeia-1]
MKRVIEAVIKIGGNILVNHFDSIGPLFRIISEQGKYQRLIVTPGGGSLANEVRRMYVEFQLSESTAHHMAILAMDQNAYMISQFLKGSRVVFDPSDARRTTKGHQVAIIAPFRLMLNRDPLPHSWGVTSDSIAAYVARSMRAEKLILVKDVDGIFSDDPKKVKDATLIEKTNANELIETMSKPTCIDKMVPKILRNSRVRTHIVNGLHPERVESILKGEPTKETFIRPG